MTELKNVDDARRSLNENDLLHAILYGNKNFENINISTLTVTIEFVHKVSEGCDQRHL